MGFNPLELKLSLSLSGQIERCHLQRIWTIFTHESNVKCFEALQHFDWLCLS